MDVTAIQQHLASMCEMPTEIKVLEYEEIQEGALFVTFTWEGDEGLAQPNEQTAIYYPQDDTLFTPTDWQGNRPISPDEIEDYNWMGSTGDDAVIIGGLPRAFNPIHDAFRKHFGDQLRLAREEKGWSQAELAKRSGIKQANISRIESGRHSVTLGTAARLAAVFGEPFASQPFWP